MKTSFSAPPHPVPLLLCGGLLRLAVLVFFPALFPGENRRFPPGSERFHSEATSSPSRSTTPADPASRGIARHRLVRHGFIPDRTRAMPCCRVWKQRSHPFHRNRLSAEKSDHARSFWLYELDCEKCRAAPALREPLGPSLGIHRAEAPFCSRSTAFRTQQDIADHLHLLQDLPRYFSDLIALSRKKSRQGVFQNDLRSMALSASAVFSRRRGYTGNPSAPHRFSE